MKPTRSDSPTSFYTKPAPDIRFPGRHFCFTGRFQFGTRKQCKEETLKHKGVVRDKVTRSTTYLVVGEKGYRNGEDGNSINKIKKAKDERKKGSSIAIVKEQHWRKFVTAA